MKENQGVLSANERADANIVYPEPGLSAVKADARLAVLDGWRAVSILLVLAAHLLPLGPKEWKLNYASGVMGMALFFILSGFLITRYMLDNPSIGEFLARRFFRIVPLAWLYLLIALLITGATPREWLAHFIFYANLPPQQLMPLTAHMWSVCLEMQFYAGIAIVVAVLGSRGLAFLPIVCVAFTLLRVVNEVYASSISYYRFDEILAGAVLALICEGRFGQRIFGFIRAVPQVLLVPLFILACLVQGEWVNYFRPYLAALLIGSTLMNAKGMLARSLENRPLTYIAGISYALYVLHPMLAASWLGSGSVLEKYAKRPLLFVALFLIAHFSTYSYERRWMALGRKLGDRLRSGAKAGT